MNGVIGMAGLLHDIPDLPDEARQYATLLKQSAENLLTIINDILDLSKLEAGRLEIELVDFSILSLCESTLEMLSPVAHGKGLELGLILDDQIPLSVQGDDGRIRQMLVNLLGNAIKFTSNGGVTLELKLASRSTDSMMIEFSVTDTGVGISSEGQSRLFQKFSQVNASNKVQGTGLGLAICKELAHLMNGDVGVTSAPDEGSRFWFTVQLTCLSEPVAPPAESSSFKSKTQIILIDPNPISQNHLINQLKHPQLAVTATDSVTEAASIRSTQFSALPDSNLVLMASLPVNFTAESANQWLNTLKDEQVLSPLSTILAISTTLRPASLQTAPLNIQKIFSKPVSQTSVADYVNAAIPTPQSTALKEAAPAEERADTAPQSRFRILCADDNQINQKVARLTLNKLGYTVDIVNNGKEAVESVCSFPYDLVLMDIQMPEMDGMEATRAIRSLSPVEYGSKPTIPIIALTANAMKGDEKICLQAGMTDYLPKPLQRDQLVEILNKHLPAEAPS